jgi:hypothetical protein
VHVATLFANTVSLMCTIAIIVFVVVLGLCADFCVNFPVSFVLCYDFCVNFSVAFFYVTFTVPSLLHRLFNCLV